MDLCALRWCNNVRGFSFFSSQSVGVVKESSFISCHMITLALFSILPQAEGSECSFLDCSLLKNDDSCNPMPLEGICFFLPISLSFFFS